MPIRSAGVAGAQDPGAWLPAAVVGHRGARGVVAENTLEGFAHVRAHGVAGVELDVRMGADSALWCLHDPVPPGSRRPLIALTAEEVGHLRLPGGQRIPRLEEALDVLAPPAGTIVEIKSAAGQPDFRPDRQAGAAVARLLDERLAAGKGDVILGVSSFDPAMVAAFRTASQGHGRHAALLAGPRARPAWLLEEAGRLGVTHVHPHFSLVLRRPALLPAAAAAGLTITCWTVNSLRTARRLLGAGVARVITDDPVALGRALLPDAPTPRASG